MERKCSTIRQLIPASLRTSTSILLIVVVSFFAGCDSAFDEDLNAESKITLEKKKKPQPIPNPAQMLVSGLQGSLGSTVGPGGALFVAESAVGRISRINPKNGNISTFASGLPVSAAGGGVYDVAFLGGTAYALVTFVGADVGGSDVVGIYRIDGPNSFTIIADIGAFAIASPPNTNFFVPTGVQYAIETYRGGFLVTDGHHNRVLHVTRHGKITVFKTFGNIVPTGLALWVTQYLWLRPGQFPTFQRWQGSSIWPEYADYNRRIRGQIVGRRGVQPRPHTLRALARFLGWSK